MTGIVIDDPVRRVKLGIRQGKAADHHNRDVTRPRQPGQSRRKANKKISVFEQVNALLQRQVAGKVLCPYWHIGKQVTFAIYAVTVNAENPIAVCFQEVNCFNPSARVIPRFAIGCGLRGYADILLFYLAFCAGYCSDCLVLFVLPKTEKERQQ